MIIDLRSDTVTRPTPGMLSAMMNASVGDDVFQEDPTVLALEEKGAALFGKEAALFCPSGTMCNQIAIKVLTQPMDEIICDQHSHIYYYEGGGWAFHSGCSIRMIQGDRGRISRQDVLDNINGENVHLPRTKLVSVENTHNKGGGSVYPLKTLKEISEACRANQLNLHLDGARIMNALSETGDDPREVGKLFDTISFCLSKGLGAPIGSLLISSREIIRQARRVRKVMGGGMRQAGFLAAAGLYAIENNIGRLKEDHQRAKVLGDAISALGYVKSMLPVETNIIVATLRDDQDASRFLNYLSENGIRSVLFGKNTVRFVTHLDVTDDMIGKTVDVLGKYQK